MSLVSCCCVVFSSTENDTALRTVLGRVLVAGRRGGLPGVRGGSLLGPGEARMEAGGIVSARAHSRWKKERGQASKC